MEHRPKIIDSEGYLEITQKMQSNKENNVKNGISTVMPQLIAEAITSSALRHGVLPGNINISICKRTNDSIMKEIKVPPKGNKSQITTIPRYNSSIDPRMMISTYVGNKAMISSQDPNIPDLPSCMIGNGDATQYLTMQPTDERIAHIKSVTRGENEDD